MLGLSTGSSWHDLPPHLVTTVRRAQPLNLQLQTSRLPASDASQPVPSVVHAIYRIWSTGHAIPAHLVAQLEQQLRVDTPGAVRDCGLFNADDEVEPHLKLALRAGQAGCPFDEWAWHDSLAVFTQPEPVPWIADLLENGWILVNTTQRICCF